MANKKTYTAAAWERQPDESERAFAAFRTWLEVDPIQGRSLINAYRQFSGRPEVKKPPGYFRDWFSKYHWEDRARRYDNDLLRQEKESEWKAIVAERKKLKERRTYIAESGYEAAEKLIAKAYEILKAPTFHQKLVKEEVGPDGQTIVQHIEIKPARFTLRDAASIITQADKLRRLSTEMATEIVETIDPAQKAGEILEKARQVLADSYVLFPTQPDEERIASIAAAFGVNPDDLRSE